MANTASPAKKAKRQLRKRGAVDYRVRTIAEAQAEQEEENEEENTAAGRNKRPRPMEHQLNKGLSIASLLNEKKREVAANTFDDHLEPLESVDDMASAIHARFDPSSLPNQEKTEDNASGRLKEVAFHLCDCIF